jgi:predicted transcriptional regulator
MASYPKRQAEPEEPEHTEELKKAREASLERLRNQINSGLEQARRGELLDGEEVFRELEERGGMRSSRS